MITHERLLRIGREAVAEPVHAAGDLMTANPAGDTAALFERSGM
jgi:hypothetical protein